MKSSSMLRLLVTALVARAATTAAEVACVTGASGYLGAEVVAQLLEAGWEVRGTVRDPTNAAKTRDLRALPFAAGEALRVTLVQADWTRVVYGDWRFLHGVVAEVRMCGVPQSEAAYARREKAFLYEPLHNYEPCAAGDARCEREQGGAARP